MRRESLAEVAVQLSSYVGRDGVYIEGGTFCIARVEVVDVSGTGMRAILAEVTEKSLVCHYRKKPPLFEETRCPFGERWEISKDWVWFYLSNDHWDGSPYLGFHLLFAPKIIEQFLQRDLYWVDDYF